MLLGSAHTNRPEFYSKKPGYEVVFIATKVNISTTIDNQRNGLETQAKALTDVADATSVIWPDTFYFVTL